MQFPDNDSGLMETKSARCLINSISRFILTVSCQTLKFMPTQKDFESMTALMKHLKPYLDEIVDGKIIPDESLLNECEKLDVDINEAREYMERWSPKASMILSVWQSELVLTRIRSSSLEICHILCRLLRASPSTLIGVQSCMQELENWQPNKMLTQIEQALGNQNDNSISPAEDLVEIINSLGLTSNQELLKERISIEKEMIKSETNQIKEESIMCHSSKSITEMSDSQNSSYFDLGSDETTTYSYVEKLVEDLNNQLIELQTSAAFELRLLAKHNMENRVIIKKCGAIPPLIELMYSEIKTTQEHAVTAILNLSISELNKAMIVESGAIESLNHVLKSGNDTSKENSAAALFSLAVNEEYKLKIGRSGAIKELVNLLGKGRVRGKKDAASALFNLSICHENRIRSVQAGAVRYLVELLDMDSGLVDKAIAILANLATVFEGCLAIVREGGIPMIVEILDCGSQRGKENAAFTLLQLCLYNDKFCSMVLEEGAVPPLVAVSQTGTPRAREKAQQLLSHFRSQRETATSAKKKITNR